MLDFDLGFEFLSSLKNGSITKTKKNMREGPRGEREQTFK